MCKIRWCWCSQRFHRTYPRPDTHRYLSKMKRFQTWRAVTLKHSPQSVSVFCVQIVINRNIKTNRWKNKHHHHHQQQNQQQAHNCIKNSPIEVWFTKTNSPISCEAIFAVTVKWSLVIKTLCVVVTRASILWTLVNIWTNEIIASLKGLVNPSLYLNAHDCEVKN